MTFLASIWLVFVIFVLHGSHFGFQDGIRHNLKLVIDLTIIFLGHNNEGIPAQTSLRLRNIDKLTFWVAAILDFKMATTNIVNQFILFPTAKNVGIDTTIEFLYCLACEIFSKQLLGSVHFAIQDGGPKSFQFKWKHWFLVFERSELSKNVYIYNSPKNSNENT